MAYDIDLDNGVLTVEGGSGHDDIRIAAGGDEIFVYILDDQGTLLEDYDADLEDVERIDVLAGAGNDWVQNETAIPMHAFGGDGNDHLFGGSGNDVLHGEGGNDFLVGFEGDDQLLGGTGNDLLSGGDQSDQLTGGTGDDTYEFIGDDTGVDTLSEQADGGIDTLDFQSVSEGIILDLGQTTSQGVNTFQTLVIGSVEFENAIGSTFGDTIYGTDSANSLQGLAGSDWLVGNGGSDSLWGDEGMDHLSAGDGDDLLQAGTGNDWLNGGNGNDALTGGGGDDEYVFGSASAGFDSIVEAANEGSDWVNFYYLPQGATFWLSSTLVQAVVPGLSLQLSDAEGLENVVGTQYDDVLVGNGRDNYFSAAAGNDTLQGNNGNDRLFGDYGADTITGGAGDDQLAGGDGNDRYVFRGLGLGHDSIADYSAVGSTERTDTLDFSQFGTGLQVNFNDGTTLVDNANLRLTCYTPHLLENIIGSAYSDVLMGNTLNNVLQGGGGNDLLYGVYGDDTLEGGAGNDTLYGGWGNDTLRGGKGEDWLYGDSGSDSLRGDEDLDRLYGGSESDQLWSDAVDQLFGGGGYDLFDYFFEYPYPGNANPRPNHFKDWGLF